MAKIFPFKGYRYNVERVEDLNKVVTQPYDKIDSLKQEEYYQVSDYNIVRLILNKKKNGENKYQSAAKSLNKWIDEDILIRDDQPSFYVYWQEYEVNGEKKIRKGFVGLGKLEGEDGVKSHENTLDGPKADRLNLLQATETNFGHIFMLYSDQEKKVLNLLDNALEKLEAIVEVNDEDGNLHKLWRITDKNILDAVQREMKDKVLYIADGHHRYQTAVNFKNECTAKGWKSIGAEGYENRLMTFVNIADPGMSILATHRLVYGLKDFDIEDFLNSADTDFNIKEFKTTEEFYNEMDRGADCSHTIGFKAKNIDSYYTLTLKDDSIMKRLIPDRSKIWRELDVVILHKAILERYLDIDEKALTEKKNINYIRYRDNALDKLESKENDFQAVFILNPTPVEDVQKVADKGERMPQKSTDFYPKLLTGLVINKLNIEK